MSFQKNVFKPLQIGWNFRMGQFVFRNNFVCFNSFDVSYGLEVIPIIRPTPRTLPFYITFYVPYLRYHSNRLNSVPSHKTYSCTDVPARSVDTQRIFLSHFWKAIDFRRGLSPGFPPLICAHVLPPFRKIWIVVDCIFLMGIFFNFSPSGFYLAFCRP